jgi:hypothetical protein
MRGLRGLTFSPTDIRLGLLYLLAEMCITFWTIKDACKLVLIGAPSFRPFMHRNRIPHPKRILLLRIKPSTTFCYH